MRAIPIALSLALIASAVHASACRWKRESESGYYKVCWYDCPGGAVGVTIEAIPCPLMIQSNFIEPGTHEVSAHFQAALDLIH